MTHVAGRTALVTGAASGIGRQLALDLADRGARVVLWDVDAAGLDDVVREVHASGASAFGYSCDVGDASAVRETAARVHSEVGRVEVLVNNAGVVHGKPLLELTDEDVEHTFRVNALAHFWTTRAFLPDMLERHVGHIVAIASTAGMSGGPRLTAYCASKHAAVGLNEALRVELARTAPWIRTTVVMPHLVDTGMFEGLRMRYAWLTPTLHTEDVSRRILDAVEHDHERLLMPLLARTVPYLKGLSPEISDALLGLLGINEAMDTFVGRKVT